jgi:hypothetical protein
MIDDNTKNDSTSEHRKTLVEMVKEDLPNPTEILIDQIIQMFIQWYNRRILILSSLIMILIPIYMISIGMIFLHSCPQSDYLPLHMIICGITSFISAVLLISISMIWKRIMKLTSNIKCYRAEWTIIIFEIIFISICLIGLIILTIVLVKISNTVQFVHQTFNYCHPILYYSCYILLFLIYSILSIILIILFRIFYAYQKSQ